MSEIGNLDGVRWLDLYAGSGAVGLEALSRGAAEVVLVESGPRAAGVIRENVERVGLSGATVVAAGVERYLSGPAREFDVVFADPPYALPVTAILHSLHGAGWLAPGALTVIERATRSGELSWPDGYVPGKARRYGETTFWYGRLARLYPSRRRGRACIEWSAPVRSIRSRTAT
jgi:16S rRNA (guanine966-N2)-methyltransferase